MKMIPESAKRAIAAFLSSDSPLDSDDKENLKIVAPEAIADSADQLVDAAKHHDIVGEDKAVASARAALLQASNNADIPTSAKRALNSFIQRVQQGERVEL